MEAVLLPSGRLRLGGQEWRCCYGHGGLAEHKQEGDGATPSGLLPLRRALFRADRVRAPQTMVPVEPIARSDGWCDDPDDIRYNQPVRLPYSGRHEALWRDDAVYDLIGVLGWNDAPVRKGLGSAIFLHIARPGYGPTEGCIALSEPDLRAALASGLTSIRV